MEYSRFKQETKHTFRAYSLKKISSLLLFVFIGAQVSAQVKDTVITPRADTTKTLTYSLNKERPQKLVSFITPVAAITYGVIALNNKALIRLNKSVNEEIKEDNPGFAAHVDTYLMFAPAAAVYGLNLMGIKGEHNFADRTGIYLISSAIMGGSALAIKRISHEMRPDMSNTESFPSGHTAAAFAAAEFMAHEYRDVSPWYGVAGYTVASAVGVLRMYNNVHWLSDVVAGAGLGIASTKLAYLIYPYVKRKILHGKSMKTAFVPTYQNGQLGFALSKQF